MEIIFAAWLLLALIDTEYRLKKSALLYSVATFLAVMGLADIFGANPLNSFWSNFERMEGFVSLLHLGAFFVVIGSVFNELNWKRWWNTTLVASGLMIGYCLLQLAGSITINQGGVRVDGTFGNASYLAVYMLIHIFIAILFLCREKKNAALRWSYLVLVLGQIFVLYHTATRGAILGLLGGLFIAAIINLGNKEDRLVRKTSAAILVGVVVIVGGFFALRNSSIVTNSPVLVRFSSISSEELKSGGRSFVWPIALQGFKERPFLGWGQENFVYVFQKHYDPQMFAIEPWFDRAHNIFLDWMVSGGILGLAAYLSLYACLLYCIWKRGHNLSHLDKSILTGLLAAYFFHNVFVFDHLVSYVLFFALMAYVHGQNAELILWKKSLSLDKMNKIALPVTLLILGVLLTFIDFKPMNANSKLILALQSLRSPALVGNAPALLESAYNGSSIGKSEVAEQLAQNSTTIFTGNLPVEEKRKYLTFATNVIKSEAEANAQNAKVQMTAGAFFNATGNPEEALIYLNRAKALSPGKQQIYFEMGSALINANKPVEALVAFKQAYEMAPEYSEAKIIYLVGAIYARDRALEKTLSAKFEEREIIFEDRILSAYYNTGRFAELIAVLEKRKLLDPQNIATYDSYIKQVKEKI